MPLVWTLLTLAAAVVVAPAACTRWGRAAGRPLSALYLAATAALWPAITEVWAGGAPSYRLSWVPALGVELALRADGLGVLFALIALLIGAVVFAYATRYLGAGRQTSFYLVMTTFTLAMVGLVLADDLVLLFVCWELTSIASFLLIARSGHAGEAAAMRTLLITFVGGLALLVAVTLIRARTGTTGLSAALADPVWHTDPAFATGIAALVAIAGFTKSAQFPFHVWLPDAMAAITPVSAYLHAAAVVKAGIFLLLRFSPAFHGVLLWQAALTTVGLTTALMGGVFALRQSDLKRLMAYSTVSQLGLIVATVGAGTATAVTAASLHVIAHALFKSGLFMMVGVIDHAAHTRDLRRLPPLARALPVSFAVTAVGCASMAGLPPLLGFASKESLFTALLGWGGDGRAATPAGVVALAAAAAASVLTFAYCAKIALGGFVDGRGDREVHAPGVGLVVPAALPIVLGLPLGPAVGVLDTPVRRAAEAALPDAGATHGHLSLWHGWTPELAATLAVFAAGGVLVARRSRLFPRWERAGGRLTGELVIGRLERALTRVGEAAVRPTAVDYPSRHLTPLLACVVLVGLGGLAAATATAGLPARTGDLDRPADAVLLVLIAAAVTGVCRAKDRLAAVVSLSAVGALCTVQMLALGAPDVTLTMLLVETLTVVVMMLVLQKLPRRFGPADARAREAWLPRRRRRLALLLAVGVGLTTGLATFVLDGRRGHSDISSYYRVETPGLSGGTNIVNVILVEFRALDTLGELCVLGMAGVVLVAVLSSVRHGDIDPRRDPDERRRREESAPSLRAPGSPAHRAITQAWSNAVALQLMLRFAVPTLAVLSLLIFARGHSAPGGGFIAALIGSSAVGLVYLSTSRDRQVGPPRLPLRLIGAGILTAVATGLWGLIEAGSFLQPLHGHAGPAHLTSSMVFDAGVYAAVLGLVLMTFNLLGTPPPVPAERSAATPAHAAGPQAAVSRPGETRPDASRDEGLDPDLDPGLVPGLVPGLGVTEDTRERADQAVEGELPGPLDTVRGEPSTGRRPRPGGAPADAGTDTGPLDTGPLDTGPLDTGPLATGPLAPASGRRVGVGTQHLAKGRRPKEPGR